MTPRLRVPRYGRGPGRTARGMTLVELMVVAVILVVIAGGVLTLFLTGRKSYLTADAFILVQQEARKAFDNMVRELRESGNISCGTTGACNANSNMRVNFQIALGYNQAAPCLPNAICWGNEDAAGRWAHYVITTDTPADLRIMRCLTTNQLDAMPANYAGCRTLARYVDTANDATGFPSTRFTWDTANQTVVLRVQIRYNNPSLPGGTESASSVPLVARVRLRNT